MQNQPRTGTSARARVALVAVFALGILPVVAGVWFLVGGPQTVPEAPARRSESLAATGEDSSARAKSADKHRGSGLWLRDANEPPARSPTQSEVAVSEEVSADQGRLDRFDSNAQRFDARIAAWREERERGLDDEKAAQLSALVEREFVALVPSASAVVECTASACVVEVTSDESVGTLVSRLAPWLSQYPDRATGDPEDPDDAHSFRIAFDSQNMPVRSID